MNVKKCCTTLKTNPEVIKMSRRKQGKEFGYGTRWRIGQGGIPPITKFDELVQSQNSDGFEKSPQARRANPEE
jgi:hypothetical protein